MSPLVHITQATKASLSICMGVQWKTAGEGVETSDIHF